MPPTVDILIVAHQSAADLPGCLGALAATEGVAARLLIVDCASSDGSAAVAERYLPTTLPGRVVALEDNLGFAGGMNRALAISSAPFVLSLNADARLQPLYIARLLRRLQESPDGRGGAATGRLIRPGEPARLDACGMRLTPTWRHLDRGSGELDRGQFSATEEVFGVTGAASLFRRAALDDVAVDGEIFASEFHSFREDAELCFRLQERGWRLYYEPSAVAEHRRRNLPRRRAQMPPAVNFHSLKNRYLLRAYHQTAGNLLLTLIPTLVRDLAALAYVLLRERSSLAAYRWLWRQRRQIVDKRHRIQARRTRPTQAIDRWFFRRGAQG